MAGPTILVHAQLPTVKPSDPLYSHTSTWVWVPCLEFPVDRVNELQFSSKPLKWIRYCIGAVTGAQGHLSYNADSLDIIDYDQPLSSDSASIVLYYHVSDAEKDLMFPTDPHLADPPKTNSVHSHAATTTSSIACEEFHQALRERDVRCLASGSHEMYCNATHLVPHCKDDDVRPPGFKILVVPFESSNCNVLFTPLPPPVHTVHQDAHRPPVPQPQGGHCARHRRRPQRPPPHGQLSQASPSIRCIPTRTSDQAHHRRIEHSDLINITILSCAG